MKLQSLNIVNTISQFHKNHPQIFRHRKKSLFYGFQMTILSLIPHFRNLNQALTNFRHLFGKLSSNFFTSYRRILNHIMHNTSLNRCQIRLKLHQKKRCLERVNNIRFPRKPLNSSMSSFSKSIGMFNTFNLFRRKISRSLSNNFIKQKKRILIKGHLIVKKTIYLLDIHLSRQKK